MHDVQACPRGDGCARMMDNRVPGDMVVDVRCATLSAGARLCMHAGQPCPPRHGRPCSIDKRVLVLFPTISFLTSTHCPPTQGTCPMPPSPLGAGLRRQWLGRYSNTVGSPERAAATTHKMRADLWLAAAHAVPQPSHSAPNLPRDRGDLPQADARVTAAVVLDKNT